MTTLTLPGCRTTPLASYLAALGVLRAVSRLLDAQARGRWQDGRFVLDTDGASSVPELADRLSAAFEPEAVVSPWNMNGGFAAAGKGTADKEVVQWVRESTDPRLAALREAVAAADEVAARTNGCDKKRKTEVQRLCRNLFPDRGLAWLDAALVLGDDGEVVYNFLLGNGGSLGHLDISANYLQHTRTVLNDRRSAKWLFAALAGQPMALPKVTLNQFDAASTGKPEDSGEVGNPWSFLLLVEGSLLLAAALVRRQGAAYARPALPFQVRGSTAGLATAAENETLKSETWLPEWDRPAKLAEVAHLFGEARAQWHDRPARSGLDMARAIASLGVDRGISAFTRHVVVKGRLGRSDLAVPVDRITVAGRGDVSLLTDLDVWLDALRRVSPPRTVAVAVKAVEQAVYTHARSGDAVDLATVFATVGRCHEAIVRSGAVRAAVRPLVIGTQANPAARPGFTLLKRLRTVAGDDLELRFALALATQHDLGTNTLTMGGLRPLLSPVTSDDRERFPRWSNRPQRIALHANPFAALAEAARRRTFDDSADETDAERPAVRGARISFKHGLPLPASNMSALAWADLDLDRFAGLLAGLLCVEWGGGGQDHPLPGGGGQTEPGLDVLIPFTGADPFTVTGPEGEDQTILVRPGFHWPALLAAQRVPEVLADAAHRLRLATGRRAVRPTTTDLDGDRLAALLLFHTPAVDRSRAVDRVTVRPAIAGRAEGGSRLMTTTRRHWYDVELTPIGASSFQPTGFPDIGAATFRPLDEKGNRVDGLLVESVQSMANRLEDTAWDKATNQPVAEIARLPWVRVVRNGTGEFLTSSRLEAHRLASAFIREADLDGKPMLDVIGERLGLRSDTPLSYPSMAAAVARLDPFCLVHGVFFSHKQWLGQPKFLRAVSGVIEAYDVEPLVSGGRKADRVRHQLGEDSGGTSEGYGSVPFHRTEWTAKRIRASFVIDAQLLRSYGLPEPVTSLLETIAQWEIRTLIEGGMRLRTACDLEPTGEPVTRKGTPLPSAEELDQRLAELVSASASFLGDAVPTTVEWPSKSTKKSEKAKKG